MKNAAQACSRGVLKMLHNLPPPPGLLPTGSRNTNSSPNKFQKKSDFPASNSDLISNTCWLIWLQFWISACAVWKGEIVGKSDRGMLAGLVALLGRRGNCALLANRIGLATVEQIRSEELRSLTPQTAFIGLYKLVRDFSEILANFITLSEILKPKIAHFIPCKTTHVSNTHHTSYLWFFLHRQNFCQFFFRKFMYFL